MIIFISALIPIIVATILWIKFRHVTQWWEFLVPFGTSIVMGCILQFLAHNFLNLHREYLTGHITQAEYYEPWNEKVTYTVNVPDGTYTTGSGRNKTTRTRYRTERRTRIDDHPAAWYAVSSLGDTYTIDSVEYENFVRRWGKPTFVDMHRNYHTKDGDKYYVRFDPNDPEIVTKTQLYQNNVVESKSVFNMTPPTESEIKSYELVRPPDLTGQWTCPSILGAALPGSPRANRSLSIINDKYGASKKLRMWIILFKNQPLAAGFAQQSLWQNGNPNDFVICIGVDSEDKVLWGHPFSWTDASELLVSARNEIATKVGRPIDVRGIVDWMHDYVPSKWKKKSFKKDFDYLRAEPPAWAVCLSVLITLGINVATAAWVIKNEFRETSFLGNFSTNFRRNARR